METVQNRQAGRLDVEGKQITKGKRADFDTLIATMMEIRASLNRMIGMLEAQNARPLPGDLDTRPNARRPRWSTLLTGLGINTTRQGTQHDERP